MHTLRINFAKRQCRLALFATSFLLTLFAATTDLFAQAGTFQFSSTFYFASETESSIETGRDVSGALVTVSRLDGAVGRVKVLVHVLDGIDNPEVGLIGALNGIHYGEDGAFDPLAFELTFDDYQMSSSFVVPIIDNIDPEGQAYFAVSIVSVTPDFDAGESSEIAPQIDADESIAFVILNDDEPETLAEPDGGVIQFSRAFSRRTENGASTINLEVNRVGGDLRATASVDYRIFFGGFDLCAGSDFANSLDIESPLTGTVNFAANDSTEYIQITLTNDSEVEFNEDLYVELRNPVPAYEPPNDDNPDDPKPATGYELGYQFWTVLTIMYDDSPSGERPPGALDATWNRDNYTGTEPPNNPDPGANFSVNAIAVQGDKTIIGGDFFTLNNIPRNRIARLNSDGSLDTTFDPGTGANNSIQAVIGYPNGAGMDGKVIIAGSFGSYNNVLRRSIARLNPDGSLDDSFIATPDGPIHSVARQSDNKLVIGGSFVSVGGVSRVGIARLNTDGSLDLAFNAGSGINGLVAAVAVQADGKIIVGGEFTSVAGVVRTRLVRLNADGTVDLTFDPGLGADDTVYAVLTSSTGKILVAGAFAKIDGQSRGGIARLNSDGSLDSTFDPGSGANDAIFSMAEGSSGEILIGGIFTSYNKTRRVGVARLLSTGKLDTGFMDTAYNQFAGIPNRTSWEPPNFVNAVAIQENGGVLIGGWFPRVGGGTDRDDIRNRSNIARLSGGSADGPGTIEFVNSSYTVNENAGSLYITVSRNNGSLGGPVSASFTTLDLPNGAGAAKSLVDYTPFNKQLAWTQIPGASMESMAYSGPNNLTPSSADDVQITILDDSSIEGDEALQLSLDLPQGFLSLGGVPIPLGTALGRSSANLVIIDDDTDTGAFTFSSPSYTVREDAGSITASVVRTNGLTSSAVVTAFTFDGTAVSGDYTPRSTTLSFSGITSSKDFTIPISNDTAAEQDEVFYLGLRNPSGTAVLDFSSLDLAFNSGFGFDREVLAVGLYTNGSSNGKIVVGGDFTKFNGVDKSGIARLLTNGVLDSAFSASVNDKVRAVLVRADGKILIGGDFTSVNGQGRNRIALLNEDGTLDTSFNPPAGANGSVYSLALESSGKILIGGTFTSVNSTGRTNIARLNANGTLDATFNSGSGPNGAVYAIALQTTNSTFLNGIVIAGQFTGVNGNSRVGIARLRSNGTYDTSFAAGAGTDGPVKALAVRSDNSILLAGDFSQVSGESRMRVARLAADGILDLAFNPGSGPDGEVRSIQSYSQGPYSGRITIGGNFTSVGGYPRNGVAMLFQNGGVDRAFNPYGANGQVNAVAHQSDNKVVIGGAFTAVNNVSRQGIARISTATVSVTIIDNDLNSGRASFTQPSYSSPENGSFATITLQRTGGTVGTLSVWYTTVNEGSAAPLTDYLSTNGIVTWNSGDSDPKTITLRILDDRIVEGNEILRLSLTNSALNGIIDPSEPGKYFGGQSNALVTIVEDDSYGKFLFNASSVYVNEDGGPAVVTVVRQGGSSGVASVSYATVDGSASSSSALHYTAASGVLTFADGEVAKTIAVSITPNVDQDGNRFFTINLANPTPVGGADLGSPLTAQVWITDEESFNEPPGGVDTSFAPAPGVNGIVYAVAVQSFDNKILVGGDFTTVNQVTRHRIGRFNSDGSIDPNFSTVSAGANGSVRTLLSQTDGRILIGGFFSSVGGATRNGIARLNLDGSLDGYFNPGSGADNAVYASDEIFISGDRKLLIAGAFASYNGVSRNGLARLNDNGALDVGFSPPAGLNGVVYALAVQDDGKVIIGGDFVITQVGGGSFTNLARLNANGSLDNSWVSAVDAPVRAIALQSNGKIVVGGVFTTVIDSVGSHLANRIARLRTSDGAVDSAFVAGAGANDVVYALTVQTDDKILVAGEFTRANDVTRARITRLKADGSVDPTINFGFGANGFVAALALQTDGDIIIGGGFTEYDGAIRHRVARLHGGAFSSSDAGGVDFLSSEFQCLESATNAVITLRRRGGTTSVGGQDALIDFVTGPGSVGASATAPSDYTATNGTIRFSQGEAIRTFTIGVVSDSQVEPDESVAMTLYNFRNVTRVSNQTNASLIILDDDSTISLLSQTYRVNEGSGVASLPVVRSGSSRGTVSVSYTTVNNGTASSGDYTPVTGIISFADGETNQTIVVPINDDTTAEGEETLGVQLLGVTGAATLQEPTTATLTILDNDFAPGVLSFSAPAYSMEEGSGGATIAVLRAAGSTGVVTVDYAVISGGTASAGVDYTTVSGTLSFADGVLSNGFVVPITSDALIEGNETIFISLSNNTGGAGLGVNNAVITIIEDDFISTGHGFTNSTPITINDNAVGSPYPSSIVVAGVTGVIAKATVSLANVTHLYPGDIDILLVAPGGQSVVLMSDAGTNVPVSGITLRFDDSAAGLLPRATQLSSGTNQPTDYSPSDAFSSPAPAGPYGSKMSAFNGSDPNGTWSLYVVDDRSASSGWISNGWSLSLTVVPPPQTNDLQVTIEESLDPVAVNGIVTYNVVVNNHGPADATAVSLFNTVPTGATLLAAFPTQGALTNFGNIIVCDFGTITNGGSASVSIDVKLESLATFTNRATVVSAEIDSNLENNFALETTTTYSTGSGLIITANTNAIELAAAVTDAGSAGIQVTSASLQAHVAGNGGASSGLFTIGTPPTTYGLTLPGIVISSGNVLDYSTGPNTSSGNTTSFGSAATAPQENLLDPITGIGTNNFRHHDVTQIDIRFNMMPGFDRVTFKVVFGSEEYPEFVGPTFIDGFGIFLNGTNIAFTAGSPININHPDMKALAGTELDGILAPGGDAILTFSAPVPAGSLNNTLTFIVSDTSDTALDTTVFVSSLQGAQAPNSDLAVAITASPEPVVLGSNLTYTITVNNHGPDASLNTTIVDPLPPGFNLGTVSIPQGSFGVSNGVVTCNIGTIPRNGSSIVTITGTPTSDTRLTNTVSVFSDLADLRTTNNTATVVSSVVELGTYFNTAALTIADGGPAITYPSVITVSNAIGPVSKVIATLSGVTHSFPADLDVLLVNPAGTAVILMSDAGGGFDVNGVTLKFDDGGAAGLVQNGQIISGIYSPTDFETGDVFAAGPPVGPYGTSLSAFVGADPNGQWKLYVMDDSGGDSGVFAGGWRLAITTVEPRVQAQHTGGNITLAWPVGLAGYVLEFKNLLGSVWEEWPVTPVSNGVQFSVTIAPEDAGKFFRLRKL